MLFDVTATMWLLSKLGDFVDDDVVPVQRAPASVLEGGRPGAPPHEPSDWLHHALFDGSRVEPVMLGEVEPQTALVSTYNQTLALDIPGSCKLSVSDHFMLASRVTSFSMIFLASSDIKSLVLFFGPRGSSPWLAHLATTDHSLRSTSCQQSDFLPCPWHSLGEGSRP